ncbi:hypothetical protein FDF50_05740 [Clostridium botulinum]|nr:hypothetical protein [Clostridium botulinum]MBO0580994.1 hypothetical protein [Clostridium botulinum]NFH09633.1 hypothetical protein [Clostridium botulinum]NFJ60986.1 hypothetical protein [Clostridium botulinum]NFJ68660.1 hypothetical protein [Clostridium botulinum]
MLIFKINIKNLINVKVMQITYDRKNMHIYKFNHFGLKKNRYFNILFWR